MKRAVVFIAKYLVYLVLIVCISFFLPRLLPGSPLSVLDESTLSQNMGATSQAFQEYYAPDRPLGEQFVRYLEQLSQGDLGYSLTAKRPVTQMIGQSIGWSLLLAGCSLLLGIPLGIWLGVRWGMRTNRRPLRAVSMVVIQGIPIVLLATVAQLLLCYQLQIFPKRGAYCVGMTPDSPGYWLDVLAHMALPLLIMVATEIPGMAIFAYNSTMRMKKEQFVQMASYLCIPPSRCAGGIFSPTFFRNFWAN